MGDQCQILNLTAPSLILENTQENLNTFNIVTVNITATQK
jgi:hypothetical protein